MDTLFSAEIYQFENFRLDQRGGGLFRLDEFGTFVPVSIGSRALAMLGVLVARAGDVVTRQEILDFCLARYRGRGEQSHGPTIGASPHPRCETDLGKLHPDSTLAEATASFSRYLRPDEPAGHRAPERITSPHVEPDVTSPTPGANAVEPPKSPSRPGGPSWRWLVVGSAIAIAALAIVAVARHGAWFALPSAPRLSLVVLPFDNLGGEPDDDYLVAGVTDDLTTALSHIPGTFVISRATAYSYRGKAEDIRRIGRDLDVRYVVRGSLRRLGSTLRVNAELSSTETGAQLWSDSFDQKVADLASGQEQIVIRMRAALNVSLADTEAARSLRERPTNPDAFDFILRARAVMLLPQTKDTMAQAVGLFQQALSRDPNAVLALVGALRRFWLSNISVAYRLRSEWMRRSNTLGVPKCSPRTPRRS